MAELTTNTRSSYKNVQTKIDKYKILSQQLNNDVDMIYQQILKFVQKTLSCVI